MTRVFRLIIYLAIALLALMFALLNPNPAQINYYFGQAELPMSLLLALAVVAGAALGVIASMGMVVKANHRTSHERRRAANAEKELTNLRGITHQDTQ